MNAKDLEHMDTERKQLSLKNMYFNRYLIIRYLTAGFFFTNLNWMVLLLLSGSSLFWVPALLIAAILPSVWEQVKLYGRPKNNVPLTKRYYTIQLIVNSVLAITLFTPLFQQLFPFMNQGTQGKLFILLVDLIGLFIGLFIHYRLKKISTNHDRHYLRIKKYEKALYLGKESN